MLVDEGTAGRLVAELEAEGVRASAITGHETISMWSLRVDGIADDDKIGPAILFATDSGYFVCFTPVPAITQSLTNLKCDSVRSLVRLNSAIRLAKLEYQEVGDRGFYYAASDCAIDGFSGAKLRKRIEACITLAQRAAKEFG